MLLSDIIIVISRPAESGNVGAVCRAMKNMGLSRLRLVSPAPLDGQVIRSRSVHGEEIWEQAENFGSLEAATGDCALVIGTTRRRGRHRKSASLTPGETASFLKARSGAAALVFGNERTGLDAGELRLCNLASHIPAAEAFPSLNLSHAVQIYCYEIYRALGGAPPVRGAWMPLEQAEITALVQSVTGSLASLGFYKQPGREEQERFFRDVFSRAGLTAREGGYMGDIFAKAARLGRRNGGKPDF